MFSCRSKAAARAKIFRRASCDTSSASPGPTWRNAKRRRIGRRATKTGWKASPSARRASWSCSRRRSAVLSPPPEPHDPALQSAAGVPVLPLPTLAFDGVGVPNYPVSAAAPDTTGAVGATQYVQWVNTAYAVFDKTTGGRLLGPTPGSALWSNFGGHPCENTNDGHPIVLYDKAANRWVMTQASSGSGAFYQYELGNPSGTPVVHQQGTLSPDYAARWMGSIAMDRSGNMLLGYSASTRLRRTSASRCSP